MTGSRLEGITSRRIEPSRLAHSGWLDHGWLDHGWLDHLGEAPFAGRSAAAACKKHRTILQAGPAGGTGHMPRLETRGAVLIGYDVVWSSQQTVELAKHR